MHAEWAVEVNGKRVGLPFTTSAQSGTARPEAEERPESPAAPSLEFHGDSRPRGAPQRERWGQAGGRGEGNSRWCLACGFHAKELVRQGEQPSPDSKQTPPVLVVRHLPGGNKGRCMVAWSVGALYGRRLGCGLETLDKKGKLAPSKGLRSGQINVVQTELHSPRPQLLWRAAQSLQGPPHPLHSLITTREARSPWAAGSYGPGGLCLRAHKQPIMLSTPSRPDVRADSPDT